MTVEKGVRRHRQRQCTISSKQYLTGFLKNYIVPVCKVFVLDLSYGKLQIELLATKYLVLEDLRRFLKQKSNLKVT